MLRDAEALDSAYDVVVAGAGTGGCVVAGRLAEAGLAVLLVEAGPPDTADPAIADAGAWVGLLGGPNDWGYAYAPAPAVGGRTIAIPRGRVLGGSSSINAMLWNRGHPSDYDGWAAAGATGWDFAAVLPYFRRAEDWEHGETLLRGAGGPLRIETPSEPHPVAVALLAAAAERGHPVLDDANGPDNTGAALANLNKRGNRRWSVVDGYIRPLSANPDLTVLTGATVLDLLVSGGACTGLRLALAGRVVAVRARHEVVLASGAIGTPALLMRSGIGDPAELARLGIPVRHALPGIGRNLQDHPLLMGINFSARAPLGPVRDNGGGAQLNWRSRADAHAPDLHAFVVQGSHAGPEIAATADLSGPVFGVSPGLMGSRSVGSLRLESAEPDGAVTIQPNFLAESADRAALAGAIDTILDLASTAAFRDLGAVPLTPARRLGRAEAKTFVARACSTFFHTCGTCAMGTGPAAVVDPVLNLHGLQDLRVADASVIPVIPTGNTQAAVVMIAERAADLIREAAR
ncbi:GMC family oxidoreductase N-terminal domain-containing protein [Methylobacterium sp. Leaf89]|uniref:GMC family oxidoreductase n=1 Tax=Methylobacterium sp. Leaf89 TaxID=1736245 RepID=UPI000701BCA4|nr:GMC family oxidoreductase N-terminal domain-containing protein [Methylobacterium sp. Leaf89]KQO73590.1 glucose-methanol-choline oxidoreductase [Methylobacterium sp. Leaf89]